MVPVISMNKEEYFSLLKPLSFSEKQKLCENCKNESTIINTVCALYTIKVINA